MDNTTATDPRDQTIVLLAGDGVQEIPVPLPDLDALVFTFFRIAINFGVQIGACLMLLVVLLAMTPRSRYAKWTTYINLAALVTVLVQRLLMVLFFTSSYVEFYTLLSGDPTFLRPVDTGVSIAGCVFAILQVICIEAALIFQAWAMIQLWPTLWKWITISLSTLIALLTVGFKCASTASQIIAIRDFQPQTRVWIQQVDLALSTITIIWFCFVFLIRLVAHMWKHRTILQGKKGLVAMDVLVVTNGVLMVIPAIFAGLQYASFGAVEWEAGSLTYCSVVLFLPVGTLVAQRLSASPTYSAQMQSANTGNMGSARNSSGTGSKKRMLGSWSHHSQRAANSVSVQGGVPSTPKEKVDPIDLELQRIDDDEIAGGGGVWVNREVELRRDARA